MESCEGFLVQRDGDFLKRETESIFLKKSNRILRKILEEFHDIIDLLSRNQFKREDDNVEVKKKN